MQEVGFPILILVCSSPGFRSTWVWQHLVASSVKWPAGSPITVFNSFAAQCHQGDTSLYMASLESPHDLVAKFRGMPPPRVQLPRSPLEGRIMVSSTCVALQRLISPVNHNHDLSTEAWNSSLAGERVCLFHGFYILALGTRLSLISAIL